jgi:hypothetical protein
MKKILIAIFCLAAFLIFKPANAQQQQMRFYYYPSSNMYYDITNKQYIYSDNGNWTTVTTLPSTVTLNRTGRVIVYSPNKEVWQQNPEHLKKYKAKHYPNGKAVGYKGSNYHKAQGKMKSKPQH